MIVLYRCVYKDNERCVWGEGCNKVFVWERIVFAPLIKVSDPIKVNSLGPLMTNS